MKAVVRELKIEKKRLVKALALMEKLLARVAKVGVTKKRHYTKHAKPEAPPKPARKKPGPKPKADKIKALRGETLPTVGA